VEVRVRRAREGRVQSSVDEQERRQLTWRAEWLARDGVERDVFEDFLWDRIESDGHGVYA
jgi:hypothetical protein